MFKKSVKLTESTEDYLEVMYILKNTKGSIKVKDIAKQLDVKPPSVVQAIQKLSDNGLVKYQRYGDINLTDNGMVLAREIVHKHDILKEFLYILGIEKKIAEEDACSMEHILNQTTIKKMEKFVEFIRRNPEAADFIDAFKRFEQEDN
ncbi:MAG: metal-dependent transcriptional regulator [Methanobacteriaceae archaeon]|nr:metal-dependent transcriptional regulator [Methanobacteriaceae archaeon]